MTPPSEIIVKKILVNTGIVVCVIAIGAGVFYSLPNDTNATTVSVGSSDIFQGDPVMITVTGTSTAGIKNGTIKNIPLHFFDYRGGAAALYGIDLQHKLGTTSISILFSDDSIATTSFVIQRRARPRATLPIPEQLGGNSPENQIRVVSILERENEELARITNERGRTYLDTRAPIPFTYPIAFTKESPIFITNAYGYNRESGSAVIPHKGTDFRAATGTPVYAISSGVVRVAKPYVVYGDTVVIDHGVGILSMYMHMSKLAIRAGDTVTRGQLIGWSGNSGYSEGAHLHLSIRIGGVSIDPEKFFGLFSVK